MAGEHDGHRRRVKLCGVDTPDTVALCRDAGVGYAGIVAVERSPRYQPAAAVPALIQPIAPPLRPVLVTQDASLATLDAYMKPLANTNVALQLHGHETLSQCSAIKARYGCTIIKAWGVRRHADIQAALAYREVADMLLLDSKRSDGSSGGTGAVFDWRLLQGIALPLPWFLSGGLDAANVVTAAREVAPPFLDLSSGVEAAPGRKDHAKIGHFLTELDGL